MTKVRPDCTYNLTQVLDLGSWPTSTDCGLGSGPVYGSVQKTVALLLHVMAGVLAKI